MNWEKYSSAAKRNKIASILVGMAVVMIYYNTFAPNGIKWLAVLWGVILVVNLITLYVEANRG